MKLTWIVYSFVYIRITPPIQEEMRLERNIAQDPNIMKSYLKRFDVPRCNQLSLFNPPWQASVTITITMSTTRQQRKRGQQKWQVSEVTLCVQILKWQRRRQRRPRVGIELPGQLKMMVCLSWSVEQVWVEEESVSRLELNKQMLEPLTSLFQQSS